MCETCLLFGLQTEWAIFRGIGTSFSFKLGKRLTLAECRNVFKMNGCGGNYLKFVLKISIIDNLYTCLFQNSSYFEIIIIRYILHPKL